MALAALLLALIAIHQANSLKCFVGLGNSSKKHDMKVVECPEGKFYVCVKMFGGGMGDQIRRYCEAIPREDYKFLQEQEELKETEFPSEDPACYDTVHNGREVTVCRCTGDKCNGSTKLTSSTSTIVALVSALAATTMTFFILTIPI